MFRYPRLIYLTSYKYLRKIIPFFQPHRYHEQTLATRPMVYEASHTLSVRMTQASPLVFALCVFGLYFS